VFKPHRAYIRQREVGRDTPSFEQALIDAMREDPDVLMVGRDAGPVNDAADIERGGDGGIWCWGATAQFGDDGGGAAAGGGGVSGRDTKQHLRATGRTAWWR